MKVLLTGASGFIGQYLTRRLQKEGYEVHGIFESRKSYKKNTHVDHKHLANLLAFKRINSIVGKVQPDFVIHLAAKTEVALSFDNYLEVSEVNYVGTVNLIEANRKHNKNLKLFIMASTMETYGVQPLRPFTEKTPQYPMAPYAVAKLACEKYLEYMKYAYSFPFCILRQTNAYGRTDNDFFVMERIISQMLNGNVCNLGEKAPVRNFIWIDDLVNLYVAILEKYKLATGETFVTGPNNGLTIHELAKKIKDRLGWNGTINWDTQPKRAGEIYYLNSVATKANKILGWKAKTSLTRGIDKTIRIWERKK